MLVSNAVVSWFCRCRSAAVSMTITKAPKDTTILVAGATGYIGKFVVQECVRQGYKTLALTRNADAKFDGATTVVADVTNPEELAEKGFKGQGVDAVISCLASRSGTKSDSFAIDYQATSNCLAAGRANGMQHFVMLSAFCVRKPLLQFQLAKLKFEEELIAASKAASAPTSYSIVRPTAFFKSVSGQLEVVKGGFPFVVFGDGTMCK
jgi:divinyl chlorophyllide a 8-vinyl-reductase